MYPVLLAAAFIVSLQVDGVAQAAETPPLPQLDEQILRQQQRQQDQERTDRLNEPRTTLPRPEPIAGQEPFPQESPCFTLQHIELSVPKHALDELQLPDASRLIEVGDFYWLPKAAHQYEGRCVGAKGVEYISRQLSQMLLDHGFITSRVLVPEQDLSSGTLSLAVLPGWIGQIRFADPSLYGTWRSAFPTGHGRLLNLRDLEQGLEQMKRVPSQDVDMQIVPGKSAGESDVVIAIKRTKPWKLVASLDDSGSKATGKNQAGLTFSWDNPLGINDLFNVGYTHDADVNRGGLGSSAKSLYYSVPLGYWTFTGSANQSRYHQTIAGAVQDFVSSGESDNMEFRVNRLMYRDQTTQFSLQAHTGKRISHSYVDSTEIDVQRRANSFGELGFNVRQFWGQTQLDLTGAWRKGVPWFGAMQDLPAAGPDAPTFYYQLETIDATLVVPLQIISQPLRYTSTFHGQTTRDALYFTDDISIGSRYTVRGFDGESSLVAEKGFYWRNELETPLGQTGQALYAGLDYGQVGGPNAANLPGTRLAGVALGLRGGFGSDFGGMSWDAFVACPLSRPSGFGSGGPTSGFQLVYQY
ncbi:ShlB/FhaC/HecB family hemolysin secretion/activation protein [Silvimonas amylolytica]|uniref:ShlB/FhaC/HecB family hemolysin secretion/activation protein n=1 Tax=Silvimonas amylolytica TaxID=449663 RepID=UPI001E341532|nr:ShlB/FhaC/HecB family hemolysin secretion/activation protein [Silvimonas amylolytica]